MCSISPSCLPEMFQMELLKKGGKLCSPNLYDRVKKLLVSYEWSDCTFSVSGKQIKAHKLILGISSPVFEAMFYGPLATDDTVVIADIHPDIFQLLLNFIYTDKVELSSIEDAFELIYASKKYMLDQLEYICMQYIEANMSIDNVVTILSFLEVMHSDELHDSALKLFCKHANYLLPHHCNQITLNTMKKILECEEINIAEEYIIYSVIKWVSFYCAKNNIPNSKECKRDFLIKSGLFQLIRFNQLWDHMGQIRENVNLFFLLDILRPSDIDLAIKIDHNHKSVVSSKVFTSDGVESFMSVNTNPRSTLRIKMNLCMRNTYKSVKPIRIDYLNNVVYSRLKASKSLFITSLFIPTRVFNLLSYSEELGRTYRERITVHIIDSGISGFENVFEVCYSKELNFDSMTDIELLEPYYIKKDTWYKISFEWHGPDIVDYDEGVSYAVECRAQLYEDRYVQLEFQDMLELGESKSFLAGFKYCL